ncbi:MAG: NAD(P)H-hydrate epimerase, partial [Nitrososphaeria archaeon]
MKVSSVEEMKRLDSIAVEKYGIDHLLLMENAGNAVYSVIQKELGVFGKKFVIIAGTGNNGGDALVVARKLNSGGGSVRTFIVGDPAKFSGPALKNYNIALKIGLVSGIIKENESFEEFRSSLLWCDAVVDGLFGTGLSGNITGIY